MKNKYNIELKVPELMKSYNLFIPINKSIGELIGTLKKSLEEVENLKLSDNLNLYNEQDGTKYILEDYVFNTNIKNGSTLVIC